MTVFSLALRSMRQNIKHYYLYFFSFIFSICLFFVFSSLKHDQHIQTMMEEGVNFFTGFQIAALLLIIIIIIFNISSNQIFLRRRSREFGLYQLIGLTKGWVARYLIIENIILGLGALLLGIVCGALLSRLFVLILINLLELNGVPTLSFSISATIETAMLFIFLVIITSIQTLWTIYRSTLLALFKADQQRDQSSQPPTLLTSILAVLGVALMVYGYELSNRMINEQLALNALLVLASTITGTYLLFRVTISWFFFRLRKRKQGHLGLYNSLSLAPIMHRMKANANSLTLITVLSALTITLISTTYSFYYSAEKETRMALPYDFTFENKPQEAQTFLAELKNEGIDAEHNTIEAIRTEAIIHNLVKPSYFREGILIWLPAEQLLKTGSAISVPPYGEAVEFNAWANNQYDDLDFSKRYPTTIELQSDIENNSYKLNDLVSRNLVNYSISGSQMLVSEATLKQIQDSMHNTEGYQGVHIDTFMLLNNNDVASAVSVYEKYRNGDRFLYDFYSEYKVAIQTYGILIFITAFLGLAFLASTGSILYFKQMNEAEQERQNFKTLRQLGFDEKMIMKGILRKQIIVFSLPLAIGVLHSIFAVKAAAGFIFNTDITIPTIISITAYSFIYLVFGLLTLGYYRKVVKNAFN